MDIGQIQDVTDSLALMDDPALQKYAMMNKDDPYIMSLAMSENNRRKKMRTAQQGQAGQMPAPKVVDQAIQSINPPPAPPPAPPQQPMPPQQAQQPMPPQQAQQPMPPQQGMPQAQTQLPEDQGIAQLPAPNMQGMADGGIAGYADGGPVRFARGDIVKGQDGKDYYEGADGQLLEPGSMADVTKNAPARLGKAYDWATSNFVPQEQLQKDFDAQRTKEIAKRKAEGQVLPNSNPPPSAPPSPPAAPAAKPAPTVKPAILAPTGADQGRGGRGGPSEKELIAAGKATAGADAAKTDLGLQSLLRTDTSTSQAGALETDPTKIAAEYAKVRDAYTPQNRFGKEIGELTAAEAAMHAQNKAQLLADIAKRGPAMAGYETRLKGREERLSKQEADLSGMSIMEAGLAMMAGTSPHALTNIGAGAQSGVKSYKAGLEKLTEARDKLDDSFSRIEELRRSEGMANDKELRQMGKGIAQTYVKAKELTLSALMKDGELGRKEAETAFTTMAANRKAIYEQREQTKRSGMEQAGANARAVFSAQNAKEIAAMPPAEARMLMQLGGGDLKKGMEIQQSLVAGKFNPMTSYADYLKGFAGKETVTPPMSYVDYVAQFQGPKLVNVAPASLKP